MSLGDVISSVVIVLAIGLALLSFAYEKTARISPAPTLPWVRRKVMDLLLTRADITRSYRIAELGVGWGGLAVRLARTFKKATLTGYEISPAPYWMSKLRCAVYGSRVTITRRDFFKEDLSGYDILICYLSPWHMEELKPRFANLKPGTLIVSNAFPIPGWTPSATAQTSIGVTITAYLYEIT